MMRVFNPPPIGRTIGGSGRFGGDTMVDHARHRSEDMSATPDDGLVAIEPTGYASMLAFSKEERDGIVLSAEEAIDSAPN